MVDKNHFNASILINRTIIIMNKVFFFWPQGKIGLVYKNDDS